MNKGETLLQVAGTNCNIIPKSMIVLSLVRIGFANRIFGIMKKDKNGEIDITLAGAPAEAIGKYNGNILSTGKNIVSRIFGSPTEANSSGGIINFVSRIRDNLRIALPKFHPDTGLFICTNEVVNIEGENIEKVLNSIGHNYGILETQDIQLGPLGLTFDNNFGSPLLLQ